MSQENFSEQTAFEELVNKELTPEMAVKVGSAIGTFFRKKKFAFRLRRSNQWTHVC